MSAWVLLLASWLAPAVPQGADPDARRTSEPSFVLREVGDGSGVTLENLCGSHTRKLFIIEQLGSGGALVDYDLDGDLDLYVANGGDLAIARGEKPAVKDALYRNDGSEGGGWRFTDVTARAGLGDERWSVGVAAGDVDGDGDVDLYVTNWGPNVLYENLGDGTFRDVGAAAGVDDPGMGVSSAFADVDADGDLDLYVVNYVVLDLDDPPNGGRPCEYEGLPTACGPIGLTPQADRLYLNRGDGTFADVSEISGIHGPEPQYGLGVAFGDYDDDGRVDVFVANDSGPNFLFHNRGGGRFEDTAWLSGVATEGEGRFQAGMGVDWGDADGDGRPDLFVTNFANDHNTLYLNQGDELFQDASYPSGLGAASRVQMAWGTRFFDFDNDRDQDLYVANGHIYPEVDEDGRESFRQPDQLFLNDGRGRFREASERIVRGDEANVREKARVSRGVAGGDVDLDGDVDLVVFEMASRPSLLENDGESLGHFLTLELHDRASTEGVGARVLVTAGSAVQRREATRGGSYSAASDARLPFGLGTAWAVDSVEIRWPRGRRQVLRNLRADRRYSVRE